MQHPDEGTIHAWLDGALNDAEAAEIAAHVQQCETCAATTAEARGLIAAASRILGQLDDVPAGVRPVAPVRLHKPWYLRVPVQAAAGLLIAALGTTFVLRDRKAEQLLLQSPVSDTAAVADTGRQAQGFSAAMAVDTSRMALKSSTRAEVRTGPAEVGKIAGKGMSAERRAAQRNMASDRVLETAPATPANHDAETMAFSSRDAAGGVADGRASVAPAPSAPSVSKRLRLRGTSALESVRSTMCNSADVSVYRALGMNQVILVSGDSLTVASEQCVAAGTPAKPAKPNQLSAVVTTSMAKQRAEPQITDTVAPATLPVMAPAPVNPPLRVLRWVNTETNRVYVLRGYVSQEELEAIRKKIGQ